MKTINKFLIRIVLLCSIIFQWGTVAVYAQGPEDEEEPIIVSPSGRLNLTLKQLGYDTKSLTEGSSVRYYRLDLPGNFQISPIGNYLDLTTSHLPEAPDKPATLSVDWNGDLVSTVPLTVENAISYTTRLDLAEGLPKIGSNSIKIELDPGGTCEDPAGFLEVLVDENSTVNFGYQQNPYPIDLALYPFPFVERSLINIPVTIVLPDQPTSDELTAAAIVAAGLGQMSNGAIDLNATLAGNLTSDIQSNHHLIVIGGADTNDLFEELLLPLPLNSPALKPGQGLIQEIVSPWNEYRVLLVVSGLDSSGVLKASHALNRQANFLGMRGPIAIVVELGLVPSTDSPVSASNSTLAALGYDDEIIYGTLPQEHSFEFFLPLGWQLEDLPFFILKFSHSSIISPDSVINVALNSVPIGSTLLDDSNVNDGELAISLPRHLLKTGRNWLQVTTEMSLHNVEACAALEDKRAWTVIGSMSEIFLPYNSVDVVPDLGLFPHPFGLEQTVLAFPDQPLPETFDGLIELASYIGTAARAKDDISLRVNYASELTQDALEDDNLIIFGRPTQNSLLSESNDYLPHPFVSNSDILKPLIIDNVAFMADPNRDAGLLEVTASPWNEEKSLLAITGTTDKGVALAIETLLEPPERFKGNLAVVESVVSPFVDDPNQVDVYSVDTRLQASDLEETSVINEAAPGKDLSALANRWWK